MALDREPYKLLENIVGPENISEEPAILDSYSYYLMAELRKGTDGSRFLPYRPGAVVIPGSAEEVRDVIKVCNRFKLKAKAHSTGQGLFGGPSEEDMVILDMVRMDRILEIDEKNRYAVIEPCVTFNQLSAEAFKLGLMCYMSGAGSHTSVLASHCTGMGMGALAWSMGVAEMNVLGVEWVLPTGDILRLGSLGSGCGWFCGDGPGPSLRGVMRGDMGTFGGLGIITKCAVKLHYYPGPVAPIEGAFPEFRFSEVPENIKVFTFTYEEREKQIESFLRLGEADIGLSWYCLAYPTFALCFPEVNKYVRIPYEPGDKPLPDETVNLLALACSSPRQMQYEEKVLEKVLTETGAKIPSFADDPIFKAAVFRSVVRTDFFYHHVRKYSGGFWAQLNDNISSPDAIMEVRDRAKEIEKKYAGRGLSGIGTYDWHALQPYDHGHTQYIDGSTGVYDPSYPETISDYLALFKEVNFGLMQQGIVPPGLGSKVAHERGGHLLCNYHLWQKKIKKAFDTNCVSDAFYYIDPE